MLVRVAKWIAVFPVGLAILWVVELLVNLLVDWVLDLRLDGLGYLLLFFASALLILVAMILAGKLASITTALLAPRPQTGLVLFGAVYVAAQLIRLYQLSGESESVWQFVLVKIEFAIVVAVVLVHSYRAEDTPPDDAPQPGEDAAQ